MTIDAREGLRDADEPFAQREARDPTPAAQIDDDAGVALPPRRRRCRLYVLAVVIEPRRAEPRAEIAAHRMGVRDGVVRSFGLHRYCRPTFGRLPCVVSMSICLSSICRAS